MNRKGFTLIELLIVVAIIGILAAVGTAVIPNLLNSAKRTATIANHATIVKFITGSLLKCEIGGKLYLKKTNGILDTTKDWCNDIDSNIASKNIDPIKNAFENHFNGEKLKNPYTGILAFICQGTSAVQYKGCVVIGDTGWYANKPPAQINIKTWFMNSQDKIDSIKNTIPLR